MPFATQLILIFLMAFLSDLTASLHFLGLAQRKIWTATWTMGALGLLGHFGHQWFVEHEGSTERILITVSGTLGAMVGTVVVLRFWKERKE